MNPIILSTAYFPPIAWFHLLATHQKALIEKQENFIKQTYRTRCNILSTNGVLAITAPTLKKHDSKTPIKDIKLNNNDPWQRKHIVAIRSAYGKSPFFIHYADEIEAIISKEHTTLWDLNIKTISFFCDIWSIPVPKATEQFEKAYPENDFREIIHPKKELKGFIQEKYIQTFSEKYPFTPGLSCLDLLFNMGPEGKDYLLKSCKYQF
jgi:hypothetical protein